MYVTQYKKDIQEYVDENVNLYKKQFFSSYQHAYSLLMQKKKKFYLIHQRVLEILQKNPKANLREIVNQLKNEFNLDGVVIEIYLINSHYIIYKTTFSKDLGLDLSYIKDAKFYLDKAKETKKIYVADIISTDSLTMEYKLYSYSLWQDGKFLELGFRDSEVLNHIKILLSKENNISSFVKVRLFSIINYKEKNLIESYPFQMREGKKKDFYKKHSDFFIDISKQKPTKAIQAYLEKRKIQIQDKKTIIVYIPLYEKDMYAKIGYNNLVLEVRIDITKKLQALQTYKKIFVLFIMASIFVLVLLFFFIQKEFKYPIEKIIQSIKKKKIIKDRSLLERNDELALIANAYNELFSSLQKEIFINKKLLKENKRFIADTVHQIRTPLSIIMMNSDLIKIFQKEEILKEFLDQIDASINMLSNSYEDLAYITSHDTIKYTPTILNLSDVLEERVEFFRLIANANHKKIDLSLKKGIIVSINQIELERLIDNNISNAIKYSFNDTTLTITLKKEKSSILLSFASFGKKIQNPDKVFEKNYREEDAKRGLGLGLNMVKNIAEKYNIKYYVTYTKGQNIFIYILQQHHEAS